MFNKFIFGLSTIIFCFESHGRLAMPTYSEITYEDKILQPDGSVIIVQPRLKFENFTVNHPDCNCEPEYGLWDGPSQSVPFSFRDAVELRACKSLGYNRFVKGDTRHTDTVHYGFDLSWSGGSVAMGWKKVIKEMTCYNEADLKLAPGFQARRNNSDGSVTYMNPYVIHGREQRLVVERSAVALCDSFGFEKPLHHLTKGYWEPSLPRGVEIINDRPYLNPTSSWGNDRMLEITCVKRNYSRYRDIQWESKTVLEDGSVKITYPYFFAGGEIKHRLGVTISHRDMDDDQRIHREFAFNYSGTCRFLGLVGLNEPKYEVDMSPMSHGYSAKFMSGDYWSLDRTSRFDGFLGFSSITCGTPE